MTSLQVAKSSSFVDVFVGVTSIIYKAIPVFSQIDRHNFEIYC